MAGVLDSIIAELDDLLAPAPRRLLTALAEIAGDPDENDSLVIDKAAVTERLRTAEGSSPSDDVIRRRIAQINIAANDLAAQSGAALPPFHLASRKTGYVVSFAAGTVETRKDAAMRQSVRSSTNADSRVTEAELEEPRVLRIPIHQVFISHGWEDGGVEKILDAFIEKLKIKCQSLPGKWRNQFAVSLWFDRQDMHGRTATIANQTDAACKISPFALFMISDKWETSPACQREAAFFSEILEGEKVRHLRIQFSGRREPTDRPTYPGLWNPTCGNLLAWAELGETAKDDFVCRIRDEICEALADLPPPPSDGERLRRAARAANRHHESVVCDSMTEAPAVTAVEGGEGAEPILPLLEKWAVEEDANTRIFALLGSFGAGKTTASQLFVRRLLDRPDGGPLPVYLDARRLIPLFEPGRPLPDLGDLIVHALRADATPAIDSKRVIELLRSQPCVVIFDGLDEVGTRLGLEQAAALYRRILEIVPPQAWEKDRAGPHPDWAACPVRILVTCRTHFFRDHIEEQSCLSVRDRHDPVGGRAPLVQTLYMAPFTPDQIHSMFRKILGEAEGGRVYDTIGRIHDLEGLARKPIMTRYIAELAPDLEAEQAAGRRINAATIYHHLFRRAMARDGEKRPLLDADDRRLLLKSLALHLWQKRTSVLAVKDLHAWFDTYLIDQPALRLVAMSRVDARSLLQTELRNASLLVREQDDAFRFVHTSFQEYFLADALLDLLLDSRLEEAEDWPSLSRETADFVIDLVENGDRWAAFTTMLDRMIIGDGAVAQRALIMALRTALDRAGRHLPLPIGANLTGLDLRGERFGCGATILRRVRFTDARLNDAQFDGIRFKTCDFTGAILSGAIFENCTLHQCGGRPVAMINTRAVNCTETAPVGDPVLADLVFAFTLAAPNGSLVPRAPARTRLSFGHWSGVRDAVFSLDGAAILTASGDGTARLWDATTEAELVCFSGHKGPVNSAVFSPNGTQVLTASDDGYVHLWDALTGAELAHFTGHEDGVKSAVFSPDGTQILTASTDKTARLWDAHGGAETARFTGHKGRVNSAVFSPDGAHILTASRDQTARLWDAHGGAETARFTGHKGRVNSAVFSPDGAHILTASDDGTARLWDAHGGAETARFTGHEDWVQSAVFSPDGAHILTASSDQTARLWDAHSGAETARFTGQSAVFSPDGAHILTASHDQTARIWDTRSGAELARFSSYERPVISAVFSSDGTQVLTASDNGIVRLWDAPGGAEPTHFTRCEGWVGSAVFSPDGTQILTGSADKTARLWDTLSGAELIRFTGHQGLVFSAVFSSDSTQVLTASLDKTVRLWDALNGVELARFTGYAMPVNSAVFSPDGTQVLIASLDKTVRLWDALNGAELTNFSEYGEMVLNAVFSPNGTQVLTASDDKTARLWDVLSGAELVCFRGHEGPLNSAVFSPNGTQVLTASDDKTARLWDAPSGAELVRFTGHVGRVNSAVFSSDGTQVLTASSDGTARLWDAATGRPLRIIVSLPDSWAVLDPDYSVRRLGPGGWRYVHSLEYGSDGRPRVGCPELLPG